LKTNANIKDVAKHAGVSMKTVSRVMNNEASVKKSTQLKVMESVKALNYIPNNSARSLAGARSYSIGYIYDNPNAYYIIDMQAGILSECKKHHFELLIHPCDHRSESLNEELVNLIRHSRLSGVVLTPPFSEMPEVATLLEKMNLPFVRITSGNNEKAEDSSIFIDDHKAAYRITEHLIELGHHDIAILCGGKEHHSTIERLEGYRSALTDNGIKPKKRFEIEGEYSFDSGVVGTEKLLRLKNMPTAIFANNDEIAAGAVFAARLNGIAIPNDLSLVGFEDSPYSRQTRPKLTTAHQPNQFIAQQAVSLLVAKIQGWSEEQVKDKNIITHFSPELVIRESTTKR
jgi:LacI family transcriptional regulator